MEAGLWQDNEVGLHLQSCDPELSLPENAVCEEFDTLFLDLEFAAYLDEAGFEG